MTTPRLRSPQWRSQSHSQVLQQPPCLLNLPNQQKPSLAWISSARQRMQLLGLETHPQLLLAPVIL